MNAMPDNPFDLSGRRILVTGASSGIGRASAVIASQFGATVVMTARRSDELERTMSMLEGPRPHQTVVCDLSDKLSIDGLVKSAGKIDGLVHAAGIGETEPVSVLCDDHVQRMFDTNYFSFLRLMRAYASLRYRTQKFSVVAVSSVAALAGWSCIAAYGGSKGALSASVRTLAIELAGRGVRVNAVCPSNILTPMFDACAGKVNGTTALAALKSKQPLGFGRPEDVANAVLFLLSDAARFITGVNLPVDGGYLAQ